MDLDKYMELITRLSHCNCKKALLFKEYYEALSSNDCIRQMMVDLKLKKLLEEIDELEKDFNSYAKELGVI